ncbi:hypothetical protein [Clostridium paridis]|uniref:Uncharacterized protein n=1 Tax=Clostridium paridis TaxID=2803863 RepID=A0A937FIZ2_9CLOT|nr:hypothetical protein [Clostridium paridis]MBL4933033.1 hypothetical protein [Clostridium paridis]
MTKADKYIGEGTIIVSNGEVLVADDNCLPNVIGKIGHIELSIEQPKEMIGIYRIEHVMLFNEDNEELYDDQSIVDNTEYHEEDELVKALTNAYGVSIDIVEII